MILDNVFNTEPTDVANIPQINSVDIVNELSEVVNPLDAADASTDEADSKYARRNQIELIEISKAAVNTAMKIAVNMEEPRAIETLALMLKTASEMNRQLVLQQKDKADAKHAKRGAVNPPVGQQTNNIIMTGSLRDLTKMLKEVDAGNIINAD